MTLADNGKSPGSHIQDFILLRELSEVYLLLDHISGRWDKTFPETEAGRRSDDQLGSNTGMQPEELDISVQGICAIGWPTEGNELKQARQAATLLLAKDRLNAAAKPANGATIAFTLMVVGEEVLAVDHANAQNDAGQRREASNAGWRGEFKSTPTRISLAHHAFPGLIRRAARFRNWMWGLLGVLCSFLVLTCALSWYVATGNIILTHLDAVHAQERELKKMVALMAAANSADLLKEVEQPNARSFVAIDFPSWHSRNADFLSDPTRSGEACRLFVANTIARSKSGNPYQICDTLDEKIREHDAIAANLGGWLPHRNTIDIGSDRWHANNEEFSRTFTQVLVSSVLPFLYGILGAGAAVVRDLWAKMRESLLSPRDLPLAYGQLALGAIVGACISLFISPAGVGGQNENILGGLVLTGSALSFVAGFGVDGVFQALESLVRRVFNNPDPTAN